MLYADGEVPLDADEDGQILIDREEKEVFRPETIASFEGKPVTITHPKEFVGPENWKELAGGIVQNVRRGKDDQADDLVADLLITDSMAIALIKNGLREVSCGYEAEYIQVEEGKGYQTNIIGNHLALVRKGRAGSAYRINDHKGVSDMKKKKTLKEQISSIFGKAQDEAIALVNDADSDEGNEADKDKDKSKDAEGSQGMGYDELVKRFKDLGEKVDKLLGAKDVAPAKEKAAGKEAEAGDEEEVAPSLEDRLKVLEEAVQKLLEREAKEDEVPVEDEDEESETDDEDAEEMEVEDDDLEETGMTGDAASDTVSRAEILSPGIKHTKDIKKQALQAAYKTKDGKKVIESLTGGKAPTFDSVEKVNTLFIAASELMKHTRSNQMSKTKQTRDYEGAGESQKGFMTAERMNEINAKHYSKKGV